MTETRKLRVFLCHSSQDKPIVRELYQRLNAEGWIDPWLDEEKLLPGQAWDLEIEKALEVSDAVIVCLSNHSTTKEGYIQKELRFVLDVADEKPEGTIFVIPLRLESCLLPRRLKMWHYLDFFPSDRQNWAFVRLLDSLKTRLENLATKSPNADVELPIAEIVQDINKKPHSESEDDLFNKIATILDKEIDFDELWLLCDDVELKMRENGETEHFSLGAFGVGRPKLHLLKDVVTYLHNHKLLHYFIDVIKNKRPKLLNHEILNSLTL